ncbi:filamentous hemagglutinin N-terminal domain-containing protein [Trinickia diaoshuihuensis]|uniref:two-partner secretion domain-containing protein n=1 Tax=Trinickia diaoshuihuensis TaxID=2292265 RepID=UPI000E22CCBB|nr:filamentous hemagglutinin N-terminal domain-containing protein [Trinickia diaoshuihuensis]
MALPIRPKLLTVALAALYGAAPLAHAGVLPSGGQFVAGSGSINSAGNSLTINQTSGRGVIDWKSFSIGSGNRVDVNNGTGATLNRVTGGEMSTILGTLSSTGSVYLINPQGIVVGKSGVVSTGGRFVASTLDADNASFMNGGPLTLSGSSKAWVVNLGQIGSTNGDVFLVAAKEVDNVGTVSAPHGTAEFAAGQRVLLQDSSNGQQVFVQLGSAGKVVNEGVINAAQIGLQAADGNVYAFAGEHQAIRATGTATRDGRVWLVADGGSVTLKGTLKATNADGSGGTVDTVARNLYFCGCVPTVSAGIWNITTPSLTIGDTAALSFSRSLNAGTSINLTTTGGAGHTGDIAVASNIGWNGAASLDLNAYRSVNVGKGVTIKNQGSGNLTLRADATAIDNGGSVLNSGTVDWSKSAGIVGTYYDMNGSYTPGTLLSNASWTAPEYSGLVTQITEYRLVNSLADLKKVSANLAGNYALGKDIDASATSDGSYVPIGGGNTAFTGQFDGQGHTISSITVLGQNAPTLGLFGTLGKSAVVRHLNVDGSVANTKPDSAPSLTGEEGILAGENDGTIVGVTTSGSISQAGPTWDNLFNDSTVVGGLVGENRGTISRSSSNAAVTFGGAGGGGLVGENNGVIDQSYAAGSVTGNGWSYETVIGGLVGINDATITRSYATGATVNAAFISLSGAGGLVGANHGTVSQSFASGPVATTAMPMVGDVVGGGIAGTNSGTIAADVYWNMDTTGASTSLYPLYNDDSPSYAIGLTTTQMSTPSSFVGWNFGPGGIWAMPAGATHPVLAWQLSH